MKNACHIGLPRNVKHKEDIVHYAVTMHVRSSTTHVACCALSYELKDRKDKIKDATVDNPDLEPISILKS